MYDAGPAVVPVAASTGDGAVSADEPSLDSAPGPSLVFAPGELRYSHDGIELYKYGCDGFLFIKSALQAAVSLKQASRPRFLLSLRRAHNARGWIMHAV